MWTTIHIIGHFVLATIFISAAIAKIRSFSEFVEYLRVPFRKLSQNIAIIVLSLEILLAVGLAFFLVPLIILTGMEIFLCGASLFIGLRLVYSNETSCKCWGGNQASTPHQETAILQLYITPRDLWINTFRPALYGYRNGLLFLGGWILLLLEKASNTAIFFTTGEMLTALIICPICIAIGLISSIIVKAYYIKQEEHPLKNTLSPYLAPLVALSWYMRIQRIIIIITGTMYPGRRNTARSYDRNNRNSKHVLKEYVISSERTASLVWLVLFPESCKREVCTPLLIPQKHKL